MGKGRPMKNLLQTFARGGFRACRILTNWLALLTAPLWIGPTIWGVVIFGRLARGQDWEYFLSGERFFWD